MPKSRTRPTASLPLAEIYPDSDNYESGGILQNGPNNVADRVEFQYNRTGELIWKKDQNGTAHSYEFDNLGRLLHDRVTALGSGVDGTIKRISTAYHVVGNVKSVTSYDNATIGSGNVVNEVKYEYDANAMLAREYQNPSGAVNVATTLYTGYSYSATKSGDFFTRRLRPTSMRYPGGTTLAYTCGAINSLDDQLNRLTRMSYSSVDIVEYTYMGLANPAIVNYPQPNLMLDYTASGALDRFNRIIDHAWKNASGTDIVRIKHGYDRVGNRLYREDVAAANAGKSFDELYAYDGVNQLIDMQRGQLNSTKNGIASGKNYEDNFAFDATGNWTTYKQDLTGAGFTLNQARTHNKANEIATIAGASTHVSHDANGNMTKCVKPGDWNAAFTLIYDAWNRLVQVKNGATTVGTYFYDGLNRRVKTIIGSETRSYYFNHNWQCVEEFDDGGGSTARYFPGIRTIDDLIMYRKSSIDYLPLPDANWNATAVVNISGGVLERYTYSAFGKTDYFDASFATRSGTTVGITRTFTGQVIDHETGLMLYRNRVYHTALGRFLQRDPISYSAGDMNLYRYVKNRNIIAYDPFGLFRSGPWWPGSFPSPSTSRRPLPDPTNKVPTPKGDPCIPPPDADSNCWTPPETKDRNFSYCCRQMQQSGIIPGIVSMFGAEHCYVQIGGTDSNGSPLPGTAGIGIGVGSAGDYPNNPEKSFKPTSCRKLKARTGGTLQYGKSKGKSIDEVTDCEIWDCIKNYPLQKDYCANYFSNDFYVCWTWAEEAYKACGLE